MHAYIFVREIVFCGYVQSRVKCKDRPGWRCPQEFPSTGLELPEHWAFRLMTLNAGLTDVRDWPLQLKTLPWRPG
jgi:hypothetical protein